MSRELRSSFSWSDLPPELLESIAGRLNPNSGDLHSFRSVCKQWRSSISAPPLTLSPLLSRAFLIFPVRVPFMAELSLFAVVSTAVHLLRPPPPHPPSATPWLVAVEQSSPDKVRLFHPLTRLPVKTLPENFPKIIANMSSLEISRGFNLRLNNYISPVLRRNPDEFCINKVILWPNPDRESPGIKESLLLVLHDLGNLTFLTLRINHLCGRIRKKGCTGFQSIKFDDIILRKGVVVAVDRFGILFELDYKWKTATQICIHPQMIDEEYGGRKRLLLDSNTDELYLVERYHWIDFKKFDQTIIEFHGMNERDHKINSKAHTIFMVYRLNSEECRWDPVMSLGDRVLFVSFDTCFFVPAEIIPGFQGNCIVFPKNCFPWYNGANSLDRKVFGTAEGSECSEVGVYNYGKMDNFKLISACPGLSDVLWPPPAWISEDTSTSHE